MTGKPARKYIRWPKYFGAKIIFNKRQSVLDCVIKNISSGGARLGISSVRGVPDEFLLNMPEYGENIYCAIVWKKLDEFGVRFGRDPFARADQKLRVAG